jgi:hypothetical protein
MEDRNERKIANNIDESIMRRMLEAKVMCGGFPVRRIQGVLKLEQINKD